MTDTTTTPAHLLFTPAQREALQAEAQRITRQRTQRRGPPRKITQGERAALDHAALAWGLGVHVDTWPCDDGDEGAAFMPSDGGYAVAVVGWTATAWTLTDPRGHRVIICRNMHDIADAAQRHVARLWAVRAQVAGWVSGVYELSQTQGVPQ